MDNLSYLLNELQPEQPKLKWEIEELSLFYEKVFPCFNDINLYSPTLKEICNIGQKTFNSYLNVIATNFKSLYEKTFDQPLTLKQEDELNKITNYQAMFKVFELYDSLRIQYEQALEFFVRCKVTALVHNNIIALTLNEQPIFLTEEQFSFLTYGIRAIGFIDLNDGFNAADNKAQEIIDKIKKGREKTSKGGSSIGLVEIVSSLIVRNIISYKEAQDLTYYSLIYLFVRNGYYDYYIQQVQQALAGIKVKNIKNWDRPITKET